MNIRKRKKIPQKLTDQELVLIEYLAHCKSIDIDYTLSKADKLSFSYAYCLDQKPVIESIIKKVRKM